MRCLHESVATLGFRVSFTSDAEQDFELIANFLFESHLGFGESARRAFELADRRVRAMRKDADALARSPFQGTWRKDLSPRLRHVTVRRAVFWFEVIEEAEEVRVLAVFFGGEDHTRRMLERMLNWRK